MERRQRTVKWPLLLGWCLVSGIHAMTHADPDEAEVKAAFVYNFAKFVEWPPETLPVADSSLSLCVLGHDPVATELLQLEGREAQGRSLHVRSLESPDEIRGCHILFVGASEAPRFPLILQAAGDQPVLTVADRREFLRQGGVIYLYVDGQRVQFGVNLGAAQSRGLKLSARLLQLARTPR